MRKTDEEESAQQIECNDDHGERERGSECPLVMQFAERYRNGHEKHPDAEFPENDRNHPASIPAEEEICLCSGIIENHGYDDRRNLWNGRGQQSISIFQIFQEALRSLALPLSEDGWQKIACCSLCFQHLLISPSSHIFSKGQVAEIGAAVGVPYGGRAVAVRNAPVFGEDFGCPLAHYGHHLQRHFSKPIFRNHFTVKCENGDLRF